MRFIFIAFLAALFSWNSIAGERETRQPAPVLWSEFAGTREELDGQTLELRDELISAHMSYMTALQKALDEVEKLGLDDPRHPLAWARTEYLLETCFRLLESTGEYDAFLKATTSLRPVQMQAPREISLDADLGLDSDAEGGLQYFTAGGESLVPVSTDKGLVLIDAQTRRTIASNEGVVAKPRRAGTLVDGTYVPLIRARAAWLRALALERVGKAAEAGAEVAPLGLIRDWAVLGPLEGVSESYSYVNYGMNEVYGAMDVAVNYPGKSGPVRWRPFTTVDPLGRLFPGAVYRGDGTKSMYALALVHSPDNQPAVMRFGSNASAMVCVNHIAARRARYSGQPDPDQEAFNIWLRRGWNAVLIRTSSSSDDWGLAARITSPDGTPFSGYVAKPDYANLSTILAEVRKAATRSQMERFYDYGAPVDMGGVSVLSQWFSAYPGDARSNFYLASFLVAKRMMEGPERFDRELIFRRAIDNSGGDPFFTLMAARSVDSGMDGPDREENLRLVLLRSVADKGSAAALADIGRLYLDVMRQPRRADECADMALSVNPMSLRAGVLDYDVAVDMRWEPVAKTLLDNLVRRHPSAGAARLRLGRASLANGKYRQALSEFHAILGRDATNHEALDGAVVALGMLGQTSAAVDLLLGHIEKFPYDFPVRLKLVELYRTLGRDEEARTILTAALAMAPDDPKAIAMRRDLDREIYAEGKAESEPEIVSHRQELDLTSSTQQPQNGWEYLYFQVEDRMDRGGAIDRTVSFALKIYTQRAARMLRHLGFWLEKDLESGSITRLDIIQPSGEREPFTTPVDAGGDGRNLRFYLPPLRSGNTVEVEVRIRRERILFLGDYFGHIAPLSQQAPVRLSRYMFTSPRDTRVFFRATNGAPEAMEVRSPDGREITRIWEMTELPAFIPEPYSLGQDDLVPCVQVSSFGDWNEFGRWYWRLIGVQYHAPPELRLLAMRMGQADPVPMAKLDTAATWIAKNIGHREWEYGPYAFRPVNARSVLSRLSADGKDRTLLLCLLAREYGLEAWPVLARLRNRRFAPIGSSDLSLPLLDHFNHSLAWVESARGDGIYMDASNPYRPSAVIPSQLFGSPGVVVAPDGAKIVTIPDDGVAACDWRENAEIVVDGDGNVFWDEEVTGVGTAAEMLRTRFQNQDAQSDAWSAFLVSIGAAPNAVSDSFVDAQPPASAGWSGRARLSRYATVEDGRVILAIPPIPGSLAATSGRLHFPLSLEDVVRQGEREQDLILPHGFRINRRISVQYPAGWHLVNLAESFTREYPFGSLTLTAEAGSGNLNLEFIVEVPGHVVAAADFPAFREMAALAERWSRPDLVWEKP